VIRGTGFDPSDPDDNIVANEFEAASGLAAARSILEQLASLPSPEDDWHDEITVEVRPLDPDDPE